MMRFQSNIIYNLCENSEAFFVVLLPQHFPIFCSLFKEIIYPLFIGEAAYREKNIAMSFTKKEILKCDKEWIDSFLSF